MNFYNDHEPSAAAWLENLQRAGEIPYGHVDSRSIADLSARDLAGSVGVHFFAGIGGWPLALRLAGWPDDQPVWTGSCPCQPFSAAGKQQGEADERHLWPEFARLIGECRPSVVFGEQVASNLGREWLARVRLDMQAMGYAVGAADLCAAGIGAPHIRQRLYFGAVRLGDPDDDDRRAPRNRAAPPMGYGRAVDADGRASGFGLADADELAERDPKHEISAEPWRVAGLDAGGARGGSSRGLGDADGARLARPETFAAQTIRLAAAKRADLWSDSEWLDCRDGKARRVKSGVRLLVDGLPGDVAPALSGFGNAIVPALAATFVRSFVESINGLAGVH